MPKGLKHTKATKKVMSNKAKERWKKQKFRDKMKNRKSGRKKGFKITEEHREKLSQAKLGNKNATIHGNYYKKRYRHRCCTNAYKEWRMSVFLRDNFTCQFCRKRGVKLEAHHIKSYAHYPKLRFDTDNGVALCVDCHKLTDNYKNKGNKKK